MASFIDTDKGGPRLKAFNGSKSEDWLAWKVKFQAVLNSSDLLDVIRNNEARPTQEGGLDAWIKKNRKVYDKLILYTEGAAAGVVEQFDDERDGVGAWQALVNKYELKGNSQKAALHGELFQDTMAGHEDPDLYFMRIESRQRRLKRLGIAIEEDTLLGIGMSKLPKEYATLKTVMGADCELTYDAFKDQVRDFYTREIAGSPSADSALTAQAKGSCFDCGMYGHFKADCPKNKQRGGGGRGGGRGRGNGRGGGRGGRGGRGQGQARPRIKCYNCGKTGHFERDCWFKNDGAVNIASESTVALTVTEEEKASAKGKSWIVDSGCSSHMVSSEVGLTNIRYAAGEVVVANKEKMASTGIGSLEATTTGADGKRIRVTLNDVLVVPQLGQNLLSVRKITQNGGSVRFGNHGGMLEVNGLHIPINQNGPLYELDLHVETAARGLETAYAALDRDLWHRRLGHRNRDDLNKLGEMDIGIPKGLGGPGKCDTCEVGKHSHASFPGSAEHRAKVPLERVHTDVLGPIEVKSLGGAEYAVMFTDDATRWRMVYFMKRKSDVLDCMKQYVLDISGLMRGQRVKGFDLKSDNGGEYTSEDVKIWCKENGIKQTYTGPYCPQQNGVAERSWRTVVDMARCLRLESGLPKYMWAEAVNTAVYIINRLPTTALGGDTPYHALFGEHAILSHLRVFGCRVYVQVEDRKKLDAKARRGILVGYDEQNTSCYRVYDPVTRTVARSVHVTFNEWMMPAKASIPVYLEEAVCVPEIVPERQQQPEGRSQVTNPAQQSVGATGSQEQDASIQRPMSQEQTGEDTESVGAPTWRWTEMVQREADNLGRSARQRSSTMCQDDNCDIRGPHKAHLSLHYAFVAATGLTDDPASYEQAMRSSDAARWAQAIEEEYQALINTNTWTLCELPRGANVIGSRWVFKTKRDETGKIVRYKARLVAQGFSQEPGRDFFDTYAPVAKLTSIRTILSIAAYEDWELENMDVDTAFLQSPVSEEIYVQQPKGYEQLGPNGEYLVCRVHKSLYGLKQSPRNWNMVIDAWLRDYGLIPTTADPCVYVLVDDSGGYLIVVLYVDDLIIAGSNKEIVDCFKKAIGDRFKMKDLGNLRWILGMEVRRIRDMRILEISQTAYIDRVLERFGMANCKPVSTPAEGVLMRLDNAHQGNVDGEYMSLVGSVLYAAMVTRPDIAYAVQTLGRHLQASGSEHWVAAKRLLRYLKGTNELGIKYGASGQNAQQLVGYCDADWGGDRDTRRSTTAYVFMLNGGCVSWSSKLQPTVALSSAEAEYMAACAGVQEAIYLRRLLNDLGYKQDQATVIYEDNQGCIALSENPVLHKRTKHIDIRYHFTRERVESGEIALRYVATEHQLADLLTKALSSQRVASLRKQVLGYKG